MYSNKNIILPLYTWYSFNIIKYEIKYKENRKSRVSSIKLLTQSLHDFFFFIYKSEFIDQKMYKIHWAYLGYIQAFNSIVPWIFPYT